jgi:hypothetical protein
MLMTFIMGSEPGNERMAVDLTFFTLHSMLAISRNFRYR